VKLVVTHVQNSHNQTARMLPSVIPFNFVTGSVPFLCWYQRQLHLWALATGTWLLTYHHHALATSRNPTALHLIGSRLVRECAKPQAHLFLSINVHDIRFKIPSLLCRNVEMPSYVVTFHLHVARGNFSKYRCKLIFHKLPVIHSQHTVRQWLTKVYAETDIALATLCGLSRPQGRRPCVGNTVPTKLSLIREQCVRQDVKQCLQACTKWCDQQVRGDVLSAGATDRNHHKGQNKGRVCRASGRGVNV
jgi:hypothetical protein